MKSNSTAFLIKIKLRHSLGRPSRSDFVQFEFYEVNGENMKIVIIHGQSHKGSTYHIAHPRDVEHWKSKGWTEKKRP